MTKEPPINVAVPRKQFEAIQDFIRNHPEQGYDSVSQAVKEAIRHWLKRKKLEEKHLIIREENEFEID